MTWFNTDLLLFCWTPWGVHRNCYQDGTSLAAVSWLLISPFCLPTGDIRSVCPFLEALWKDDLERHSHCCLLGLPRILGGFSRLVTITIYHFLITSFPVFLSPVSIFIFYTSTQIDLMKQLLRPNPFIPEDTILVALGWVESEPETRNEDSAGNDDRIDLWKLTKGYKRHQF